MLYVICVTYFSGKKLIDQNNRLEWSVELVMELVWVPLRFLFSLSSNLLFDFSSMLIDSITQDNIQSPHLVSNAHSWLLSQSCCFQVWFLPCIYSCSESFSNDLWTTYYAQDSLLCSQSFFSSSVSSSCGILADLRWTGFYLLVIIKYIYDWNVCADHWRLNLYLYLYVLWVTSFSREKDHSFIMFKSSH